ncbi:hypothetical protein B484DRAFT_440834, partial [Ochromonadaceae sp. CCMP2298]
MSASEYSGVGKHGREGGKDRNTPAKKARTGLIESERGKDHAEEDANEGAMEVDFGTPLALQRGTVHETEQDVKLCNAGPTGTPMDVETETEQLSVAMQGMAMEVVEGQVKVTTADISKGIGEEVK